MRHLIILLLVPIIFFSSITLSFADKTRNQTLPTQKIHIFPKIQEKVLHPVNQLNTELKTLHSQLFKLRQAQAISAQDTPTPHMIATRIKKTLHRLIREVNKIEQSSGDSESPFNKNRAGSKLSKLRHSLNELLENVENKGKITDSRMDEFNIQEMMTKFR